MWLYWSVIRKGLVNHGCWAVGRHFKPYPDLKEFIRIHTSYLQLEILSLLCVYAVVNVWNGLSWWFFVMVDLCKTLPVRYLFSFQNMILQVSCRVRIYYYSGKETFKSTQEAQNCRTNVFSIVVSGSNFSAVNVFNMYSKNKITRIENLTLLQVIKVPFLSCSC